MKRQWKRVILAVLLPLLLAGCASSGQKFDGSRAGEVKIGVQDKATITEWFGKPLTATPLNDSPRGCIERWTYTYASAIGFGLVTESHALIVDFDANGKVCDHAYTKLK